MFQESKSHHKILDAPRATASIFHTESPQYYKTNWPWRIVAQDLCAPGMVNNEFERSWKETVVT